MAHEVEQDLFPGFASLDVAGVHKTFALNAWHWFFLAQSADLPERMLAAIALM
ncbi:hypothetical protein BSFA1_58750 [Burkholderia sp. SFA1]|nr:hypothetical protein [Caballeronia sp. CLC5]BBQ00747.1 hypothetical protein BSFA1_58750 [Burkholderia sp. SFA1]